MAQRSTRGDRLAWPETAHSPPEGRAGAGPLLYRGVDHGPQVRLASPRLVCLPRDRYVERRPVWGRRPRCLGRFYDRPGSASRGTQLAAPVCHSTATSTSAAVISNGLPLESSPTVNRSPIAGESCMATPL